MRLIDAVTNWGAADGSFDQAYLFEFLQMSRNTRLWKRQFGYDLAANASGLFG